MQSTSSPARSVTVGDALRAMRSPRAVIDAQASLGPGASPQALTTITDARQHAREKRAYLTLREKLANRLPLEAYVASQAFNNPTISEVVRASSPVKGGPATQDPLARLSALSAELRQALPPPQVQTQFNVVDRSAGVQPQKLPKGATAPSKPIPTTTPAQPITPPPAATPKPTNTVRSHLWRNKGKYGLGALAAGAFLPAFAAGAVVNKGSNLANNAVTDLTRMGTNRTHGALARPDLYKMGTQVPEFIPGWLSNANVGRIGGFAAGSTLGKQVFGPGAAAAPFLMGLYGAYKGGTAFPQWMARAHTPKNMLAPTTGNAATRMLSSSARSGRLV